MYHPTVIPSRRGEHFSGVISRQSDGVVRCTGAIPADQACNIIRIEGLNSIRRFSAAKINVSQATLVKADQDNTQRALAAAKPKEPFVIAPVQKDAKGQVDWKQTKALRIENEGQPVTAEFRAAYDADALYVSYTVHDPTPWKNSRNEFRLPFKTGDCVDWSNKHTNLVNDQPGEAVINPLGFGECVLAK